MPMIFKTIGIFLLAAPFSCFAGTPLTCAQNEKTNELMCFATKGVSKNGDYRSAKLWRGGPKEINQTSFTARVYCPGRVLELSDRKGVVFVRNIPSEPVGKDFVRNMCDHSPTKNDPSLKTN